MKTWYKILDADPKALTIGGWQKDFLTKQVEGLPGHLEQIGYPFNEPCWTSRKMTGGGKDEWWPYEQSAYWIDSIVRSACVLHDERVMNLVKKQIDDSIVEDGEPFMGPVELKSSSNDRSRWPHAVYFRALWATYLYTGDEKYLLRMRQHYMNDANDYGTARVVANAEIMYRLAEHFNDKELQQKASRAIRIFDRKNEPASLNAAFSDRMHHYHGVTVNECMKLGAVSYLYTGNRHDLDATIHEYERLNDFYMLPDGLHSCYEFTTGNESFKAHESCDLSDYSYSLYFLLKATGDGKYADRIERLIYNALPGSIGPDFKSIQYFSGVNQVIVGRTGSWLSMWETSPKMTYQAHHYPECCIANIGRAFPNFCMNLYGDTDKGLAVNFYGESSYKGRNISASVSTNYPFDEEIVIRIDNADDKKNTLSLRIPAWTKEYTLTVNGKKRRTETVNGYAAVRVRTGDTVVLSLCFGLTPHHSSDGGIWYSYGPFTLAMPFHEKWERDLKEKRQSDDFPAWNVRTDDSFAYALSGYECGEAKFVRKEAGEDPFFDGTVPFEIRIPARKLEGWSYRVRKNSMYSKENPKAAKYAEGIDEKEIALGATFVDDETLVQTPRLPSFEFVKEHIGEECEITLVPYGCTHLRLTVFPKYDFEA